MKITSRQLRQIIKEELARTGFGRLRESAGSEASIALSTYFEMPEFAKLATGLTGDKLDSIAAGNLVIKMGDKGPVVKVIQALVKGKLNQAMENTSQTSYFGSTMGSGELGKAVTGLGEPDGDFGDKTRTAVMVLQKVMKDDAIAKGAKQNSPELPIADGKVGRQTLTFLLGTHGASATGETAAPPTAPRSFKKSQLIAAIQDEAADADRFTDALGIGTEQLASIINLTLDDEPHAADWWVSRIKYGAKKTQTEINDIALKNTLDIAASTIFAEEPAQPRARSGTYSREDIPYPRTAAPMKEGRDLTSRLMNRWLK